MNHDTIFIIDDNDSEDNGDCVLKSEVEQGTSSLSDRFNEIAHEMTTSKKEKRKKDLILKGLVKSNTTKADFSLDTKRDQDLITPKEESAIEPQDMKLGEGKKITVGMNLSDGINQSTAYQ
eukprot:6598163-Ditylum_brightwellii.AAC.1